MPDEQASRPDSETGHPVSEDTGVPGRRSGYKPDVTLDVPTQNIEEIELEAEHLQARASLNAELGDFVKINVGVNAYANNVRLGMKGVEAQALLEVNLERVLDTFNRALEVIEQNPGVLGDMADHAGAKPESDKRSEEINATEAARKRAQELGVDLSNVEGTGSGGRILVRDVRRAANRDT